MTTRTEKWLDLIIKIIDDCENPAYNAATNDATLKFCWGWLDALLKERKLSSKQTAHLEKTLQERNLRFRKLRIPAGGIKLTPDQIKKARNNEKLNGYRRYDRQQTFVKTVIIQALEAKMEDLDFTDTDVLNGFLEHMTSFDPTPVEEPVLEKIEPSINGALPDGIMNLINNHKPKFPSESTPVAETTPLVQDYIKLMNRRGA